MFLGWNNVGWSELCFIYTWLEIVVVCYSLEVMLYLVCPLMLRWFSEGHGQTYCKDSME